MKFLSIFSLSCVENNGYVRGLNKCKNRFTAGDVMKRKFSTELRKLNLGRQTSFRRNVQVYRYRKFRTADKKVKTKVRWPNNLTVPANMIEIIFIISQYFVREWHCQKILCKSVTILYHHIDCHIWKRRTHVFLAWWFKLDLYWIYIKYTHTIYKAKNFVLKIDLRKYKSYVT